MKLSDPVAPVNGKGNFVPPIEGIGSGRLISRFKRNQPASEQTRAFGLIKNTYQDAIEYKTVPAQVRGLIFLFGLAGALVPIFGVPTMYAELVEHDNPSKFDYAFMAILAAIALFTGLVLVYTARLEFFRPIDEPVIFDRKNRKIYRVFRAVQPGVKGLFQRWPLQTAEHRWDTITGEYRVTITPTGSTVSASHALHFVAVERQGESTLLQDFQVANPLLLGEFTIGPFWEHIRRFMEESGPHVPSTEAVNVEPVPSSLWQSLGAVGPFGPNYFKWWRTNTTATVFMHLFIWLVLPFSLVWAVLNWLSYATATSVHWPASVIEAIGPANE
ncbi:hypothetical protein KY495_07225 [Massilia sp. PAMC28688]|uniref:DUF6708 domain-containing protein n=1 Tax=Massilia sp. PAMC28688 TaxID=2861283 RepID=UPI001C62DEE1|nr:DUF6708 domain-containing protein [Massilia sp. PAMC28688]QYF94954.1 hypothetical protein KY495_07225 [Massilia sp. PAMC28688]